MTTDEFLTNMRAFEHRWLFKYTEIYVTILVSNKLYQETLFIFDNEGSQSLF